MTLFLWLFWALGKMPYWFIFALYNYNNAGNYNLRLNIDNETLTQVKMRFIYSALHFRNLAGHFQNYSSRHLLKIDDEFMRNTQELHYPYSHFRFSIGGGTGDRRRSELWQHISTTKTKTNCPTCLRFLWIVSEWLPGTSFVVLRRRAVLLKEPGKLVFFFFIRAPKRSGHALFLNLTPPFFLTFRAGKWYLQYLDQL